MGDAKFDLHSTDDTTTGFRNGTGGGEAKETFTPPEQSIRHDRTLWAALSAVCMFAFIVRVR